MYNSLASHSSPTHNRQVEYRTQTCALEKGTISFSLRIVFKSIFADLQIDFVLRFYGPVNLMGSCRARSVYLTTRLLDRLSPLSG